MAGQVLLFIALLAAAAFAHWWVLRLATRLLRPSEPMALSGDVRRIALGAGRSLLRFVVIVTVFVIGMFLTLLVPAFADVGDFDVGLWIALAVIYGMTSYWLIRYLLKRGAVERAFAEEVQASALAASEEGHRGRRMLAVASAGLALWAGAATFYYLTDDRRPLIFLFPALGAFLIWQLRSRHPRLWVGGCLSCAIFSGVLGWWGLPACGLFLVAIVMGYRSVNTGGETAPPGAESADQG